ncbi:glycoside hydrolase family 45 protein [Peniophora sp. CONT]|nr:glycoside hydrolase family 45 protein [Peniophora sp. CONT]
MKAAFSTLFSLVFAVTVSAKCGQPPSSSAAAVASSTSSSLVPAVTNVASASGYVQIASGSASFTSYTGCGSPACGKTANGFTVAVSQLTFGSEPGLGAGDVCGRCFAITATTDPYSPSYTGPFNTIVVKATDMCPSSGNGEWCGQSQSNPLNEHGAQVHFDLCQDTGAAGAFFPSGHGALTGSFEEVSCAEWSGSDGSDLWNGACLSGESAGLWPGTTGCGNKGTPL